MSAATEAHIREGARTAVNRERGVSTFLWGDSLAAYDTVPFVWRHDLPPLPEHGLQIDQADDGTWRTYQTRYPGSTLTSGHVDNIEVFWALHAMRKLATWATAIDVRIETDVAPGTGDPDLAHAEIERELLAGRVDRVGKRFAKTRGGPEFPADLIEPVKGATGVVIGRLLPDGKKPSDWGIHVETTGQGITGYCIPTKTRARECAKALAAVTDWRTVPEYAPDLLPNLKETVRKIRYRAATGKDYEATFGGEAA